MALQQPPSRLPQGKGPLWPLLSTAAHHLPAPFHYPALLAAGATTVQEIPRAGWPPCAHPEEGGDSVVPKEPW